MDMVSLFAVFGVLVAAPSIVFGFLYLSKRNKNQLEMMRYRKESLELEVRREELRAQVLREESRMLDRQISERISIEDAQRGKRG